MLSGAREPRVGGIILAVGVTASELDDRLAQDPFQRAAAATYRVEQFTPSRSSNELRHLLDPELG